MKLVKLRTIGAVLLTGFFLFFIPIPSSAQEFPTKPINILMAFAAGGNQDIATRVLAGKVEKILRQPVVVTNNGGGGGTIALAIAAKDTPDGYHLVSFPVNSLIGIPQLRKVNYKYTDFDPILSYGVAETGLVVRGDSPWKTHKDFVEYAKKNPGKIKYGSSGQGTPMHMAMEYVAKQEGGIQWTMIPYTGVASSMTDLLGGHITAVSGGTAWIPYVNEGTLRLLVTHGEKRMPSFPNVPTLHDLGYDYVNYGLFTIAAPDGTPPAIVTKLTDAFRKAMDDPEFISTMKTLELPISYRGPAEMKKLLEESFVKFGTMVKDLKVEVGKD
jgi:tripartite-type tricarboxylate transporter receptor subunit TctC